MQLIHYAEGAVLTGTTIADALVDYAQVLAATASAATVHIPTRESDGSIGRATFLLGPSSQIVAVDTESRFDEVRDDDLVRFLEAETTKQRGAAIEPSEQTPDSAPTDLEWEQ